MAQIKGLAIRARLDYLERNFGKAGLTQVVDALTPEHRKLMSGSVLVSGWYPLSLNDDLLGSAERLLGKGDGALCREIGKASGQKGLSTIHAAFAGKPGSAEIGAKMARSTKLLWSAYYDTGAMTTRPSDDYEIQSELTGLEVRTPWMCHVLTGYISAHIEVLGGRHVTVEHAPCRARGQTRCVWTARWQ